LPGLEVQRLKSLKLIAKNRQKLQLRLRKLAEDRARVEQADFLQRQGELLLTYQHQIARGADSVELLDFDGCTPVKILLEPALPVVVQAQKLMKRASKYRRSLSVVEARVQETEVELKRLEELAFQVEQAEALIDLHDLSLRPLRKSSLPAPRAGPRVYHFDRYRILVGRSPRQNDQLVQKFSARDDLWFHVKDAPGAHVLLKTAGRPPGPDVIEACAFLAARYSSKAKESRVLVSFAAAQKVKKPAQSPAGFVLYTEELTLWVKPDPIPQGLVRGDLEASG
jgi:predicted ribosome quality control (RQC) complex YloA/Tae2 family protein